jgi:hypothetical protein
MSPFIDRFPDVAGSEMLVLHVQQPGLPLPQGKYGFFEWYCEDDKCDCRRVLLRVLSPQFPDCTLATINYGWESQAFYTQWMHGDKKAGREITSASLDPLNPNSGLAEALLKEFRAHLRTGDSYAQMLKRHYELFKGPQGMKRGK